MPLGLPKMRRPILTAGLVLWFGLVAPAQSEPGGKSLDWWISRLKRADEKERSIWRRSLIQLGRESIDVWRLLLRMEDPALVRIGLDGVGALGPIAAAALPDVMRVPGMDSDKILALGRIGPPARQAVSHLEGALVDPQRALSATVALAEIDPANAKLLPAIRKGLHDKNSRTRWWYLTALQRVGRSGGVDGTAVATLVVEFLSRPNRPVYLRPAVRCLAILGTKSPAKSLEPLLESESERARVDAAFAVATISGARTDAGVRAMLERMAKSDDAWVRLVAAAARLQCGERAGSDVLKRALQSGDSILCREACDLIRILGPKAATLRPALEATSAHQGEDLLALASIGVEARDLASRIDVVLERGYSPYAADLYRLRHP